MVAHMADKARLLLLRRVPLMVADMADKARLLLVHLLVHMRPVAHMAEK